MDVVFEDRIFTTTEAASHLRIGRTLLYDLIAADKIQPLKIGKRTFFTGRELKRFVDVSSGRAAS